MARAGRFSLPRFARLPRRTQVYKEALRFLPKSAFVLEQMAHLERRLGQFEVAQKYYQAAAKLDPRDIGVLLTLADSTPECPSLR